MLELVPVTLRDARRFVGLHHRHNLPPRGWKFGVGIASTTVLEERDADTPGAQRVRAQHDLFGTDRRPAGAKIRWRRTLC